MNLQLRTSYSDGTQRPLLRGCLHALVSFSLFVWLLYLLLYQSASLQIFVIYVFSKFLSYISSALYHLLPVYTPTRELILLKLDTVFISVAIWSPINLFVTSLLEWQIMFILMLCITALNAYIVHIQFTENKSHKPRIILLMMFSSSQMIIIGWHVNFSIIWWIGTLLYLSSFCLAPPMNHYIPNHLTPYWHKTGVYGWHEDFHLLLLIADVTYLSLS